MPADAVIVRAGPVAVPLDYRLPTGTEIVPKVVTATLNGTGAGGPFLAVLEVLSPNGTVTARCLRQESIAAGASASVSWFPGGGIDDATAVDVDTAAGISQLATGGSLAITNPTGPDTIADVAPSGVAAATYGDSTHTAQVTVGVDGRVNAASSVPISGSGGAGGLVTLYDSGYLGADAASIDTGAAGIAAGHGNLMIFCWLRTADASTNQNIVGRFNNDAGANYNYSRIQNAGGVTGASNAAQTSFFAGIGSASLADANVFAPMTIEIPAYDQTTNKKAGNAVSSTIDSNTGHMVQSIMGFMWASTAAISRFAVFSSAGGNLKAGSRMMVCGTQ